MHVRRDGQWVRTFTSDNRSRVRLNGVEAIKTFPVTVGDPDGSVTERVESLSHAASVLAAASARNRVACGRGAEVMTAVTELPAEPLWAAGRSLRIGPQAASAARDFTREHLGTVKLDADHVDDVVRVVSELVANATIHGAGSDGARNVSLELGIWSKWTLLTVDDRDPNVYDCAAGDDPLAESGRGLLIVRSLAERFWWRPRAISKTANAVILRPDADLTSEDHTILDRLEKE